MSQAPALILDLSVPLETVGLQGMENIIGGAGNFSRWIKVFDADQPLAPMAARIKIASKGGHKGSEVQGTGGRGGESSPI
jgi:hypothetical protein